MPAGLPFLVRYKQGCRSGQRSDFRAASRQWAVTCFQPRRHRDTAGLHLPWAVYLRPDRSSDKEQQQQKKEQWQQANRCLSLEAEFGLRCY